MSRSVSLQGWRAASFRRQLGAPRARSLNGAHRAAAPRWPWSQRGRTRVGHGCDRCGEAPQRPPDHSGRDDKETSHDTCFTTGRAAGSRRPPVSRDRAAIASVLVAAGAAAWSAASRRRAAHRPLASTDEARRRTARLGRPAPRTARPASPRPSRTSSSSANGIRQHVVIGGDGPPLLLVHGWPENWYAWRHVMPDARQEVHRHRGRPARNRAHREGPDRATTPRPSPATWPRS